MPDYEEKEVKQQHDKKTRQQSWNLHAIQEQAKEEDKTCYKNHHPEKDQPIENSAHLRHPSLGLEDGTKVIRKGIIVLLLKGTAFKSLRKAELIRMRKKIRRLWKPHCYLLSHPSEPTACTKVILERAHKKG